MEIGIYSLAQNHKLPVNKIKWLTRDLSIEALFYYYFFLFEMLLENVLLTYLFSFDESESQKRVENCNGNLIIE